MAGRGSSFYVTTPIYYVNDVPHIGHAYTTIACDVLARFMRLDGRNVRFLTGTDEHGQKVEKSAAAAGEAPRAFVDRVSQRFRELVEKLDISHDDFIRTTEDRHIKASQAIWQALIDGGHIYLGSYAGWYSVRDEAFYAESEIVDGKEPSGAPVEWVEEPSYFFRLSAWQQPLLDFYRANPDFIAPQSRRNEVMSFVEGGLLDLSVSRTSFSWGVPVPNDPDHVMYVWLDALTNYITAVGYPNTDDPLYQTFWPANVHVVGKDILRFHAVYWPAFLMAAGLEPPRRVFAHGWWTVEGQKMSKSLRNVVDPFTLVDSFGLDQVRYFLMREVPFGNDGDFSRKALIGRLNNDLANDFGNLSQRVLSMIARNCGGKVPEPGALTDDDKTMLSSASDLLGRIRPLMETQTFHEALDVIWTVIRAANSYVDRQAPWALKKTDPARMGTVLWVLAETIRRLAFLTQPFVPGGAGRMLDQLAIADDARDFAAFDTALVAGTALPAPSGIFPRFAEEDEAIA
ncbi:MAG: methionine--tRNA ligase [Rhodospirillaceae bacterium]|nr:methionine--tRNA ligase [Rhodospirillaceae bacterium]